MNVDDDLGLVQFLLHLHQFGFQFVVFLGPWVASRLPQGGQAERKQLVRTLVGEVKLMPQDLEVSISYRLPEAIIKDLVAGVGFEPTTFGL